MRSWPRRYAGEIALVAVLVLMLGVNGYRLWWLATNQATPGYDPASGRVEFRAATRR